MNDTKKKKKKSYYSPSALARWGHNSRKRLCRQEGEVSREYVHPWVAAGGVLVVLDSVLEVRLAGPRSPPPSPRQPEQEVHVILRSD